MLETRLKLKNPTRPQLSPPIIIRMRISFFKVITPFEIYFCPKMFFLLIICDTIITTMVNYFFKIRGNFYENIIEKRTKTRV